MSLYDIDNQQKFFCDICDYPVDDLEIAKKWGSCEECYLKFIEANRPQWLKGKRPTKGAVSSYLTKKRKFILSNFKGIE